MNSKTGSVIVYSKTKYFRYLELRWNDFDRCKCVHVYYIYVLFPIILYINCAVDELHSVRDHECHLALRAYAFTQMVILDMYESIWGHHNFENIRASLGGSTNSAWCWCRAFASRSRDNWNDKTYVDNGMIKHMFVPSLLRTLRSRVFSRK